MRLERLRLGAFAKALTTALSHQHRLSSEIPMVKRHILWAILDLGSSDGLTVTGCRIGPKYLRLCPNIIRMFRRQTHEARHER